MEPIVSRDYIRQLAWALVDERVPLREANPFPEGTQAHAHFERDFIARERELQLEEVC